MESVLNKIRNFFKTEGSGDYDIAVSQFPRDAMGIIRSCIQKLPEGKTLRVYAVGGDGILFDCLNGIMGHSNVELGIIPYGRTNDFVRGFCRKNSRLFHDLALQCTAPAIPIDVIQAGNNYALGYCAVGMEADSVRQAMIIRNRMERGNFFSRWLSRRLYVLFYFIAGISACLNKKLLYQNYTVSFDDEIVSGVFRGLSIFNAPYYGGIMHPINNAMPNDGILDAVISRSCGIPKTYCLLPFYIRGNYEKFHRNFIRKQGRKITIHSDYPLIASVDDIVFFDTELTVELLPSAVQFIDPTKKGYGGINAGK